MPEIKSLKRVELIHLLHTQEIEIERLNTEMAERRGQMETKAIKLEHVDISFQPSKLTSLLGVERPWTISGR